MGEDIVLFVLKSLGEKMFLSLESSLDQHGMMLGQLFEGSKIQSSSNWAVTLFCEISLSLQRAMPLEKGLLMIGPMWE